MQAVGALVVRERQRSFADESVRLAEAHCPVKAHVVWRHRAIRILSDDDEAFLGAQHVHGLGPVGRDPIIGTRRQQRLPNRSRLPGRDVDLEAQLAAEADAEDARRHVGHVSLAIRHERERLCREVDVRTHAPQHFAGLGADHGRGRPMIRDGGEVDVQVRPLRLAPQLKPREDGLGVARRRVHQVALVVEPNRDAVVEDQAVVLQHHPVSTPTDAELQETARVDPVEEPRGIAALHVDLAKRRGVHYGDACAGRDALPRHRGIHILAGLRVVAWTLPSSDILPDGAAGLVPRVDGRMAFRVEEVPDIAAGDGAERGGRVRGAEHRRADLGDLAAQGAGQDGDAVDVAELTLICAEPEGRVALGMLD